MTYRKGDRVSIQGIVKHNQDDNNDHIFIDVVGHYKELWIELKDITLVTPLFEVGDKCTWKVEIPTNDGISRQSLNGIILATIDDHAWIKDDGGNYCTRLLTSIERVDDETEL